MAADFIDGLSIPDQKKAVRLLKEFADRGEIRNREKFRLEEPPIYALKSFQVRILCFFLPKAPKRTLVLTHGFIKKSDDAPTAEIERAKRIYVEVVESSGRRKHT
jgi:phage-related protein